MDSTLIQDLEELREQKLGELVDLCNQQKLLQDRFAAGTDFQRVLDDYKYHKDLMEIKVDLMRILLESEEAAQQDRNQAEVRSEQLEKQNNSPLVDSYYIWPDPRAEVSKRHGNVLLPEQFQEMHLLTEAIYRLEIKGNAKEELEKVERKLEEMERKLANAQGSREEMAIPPADVANVAEELAENANLQLETAEAIRQCWNALREVRAAGFTETGYTGFADAADLANM